MTGWDAIYNKAVKGKFKLSRQNNAAEHTLQERVVEVLRRHWCIAIDTDVMDAKKFFKGDNVQTNGSGGGSPLTPKLPPLKAK